VQRCVDALHGGGARGRIRTQGLARVDVVVLATGGAEAAHGSTRHSARRVVLARQGRVDTLHGAGALVARSQRPARRNVGGLLHECALPRTSARLESSKLVGALTMRVSIAAVLLHREGAR